jgi:hypothetical protein
MLYKYFLINLSNNPIDKILLKFIIKKVLQFILSFHNFK